MTRRPANLSLDAALAEKSRAPGLNLPVPDEAGLRAARWLAENAEALASSNAWVEAKGLPLARHRPF